jgi:hypothetical protein
MLGQASNVRGAIVLWYNVHGARFRKVSKVSNTFVAQIMHLKSSYALAFISIVCIVVMAWCVVAGFSKLRNARRFCVIMRITRFSSIVH